MRSKSRSMVIRCSINYIAGIAGADNKRLLTRLVSRTAIALSCAGLSVNAHAADSHHQNNFEGTSFQDIVQWDAWYTVEAASNISGGQDRGSAYAGQIVLDSDIDLEKAFNWKNTNLNVLFTSRHGSSATSSHIGSSTSIQEVYGGNDTRLSLFSIEKTFFDGQLEVEGGRMAGGNNFFQNSICQYFQNNAACGNPTFIFRSSQFSYWPVAAWGARVKYHFSPKIYAHIGAYEDNRQFEGAEDHGFDWSTDESKGVVLPFMVGYQTTWETARYPATYEVGGWYDTSTYNDPLNDEAGNPAGISGNDYAQLNGRSGWYASFEKVVTRPDPDKPVGLKLFGDVYTKGTGTVADDYYIKLGFLQQGTWAGRDEDAVGLMVIRQQYTDRALENQRLARARNGGTGTPASSMTMIELTYSYHVNDVLRITPNLHYIINPDQFNEPGRTENLNDAFALGLRFDVDLKGLLYR
ncbi:carbohydrate porin [Salinimonas lutimaris]|uniref:carbohydrate porin n=1 Tax=Salinimonas lutimaris TaxID=914153 RepID=UPI001E4ACF1F|nr:carbohydrate porin [Salinimonas lutimaris]